MSDPLDNVDTEMLEKLWRDGVDSGNAGRIDFAELKAEARRQRRDDED